MKFSNLIFIYCINLFIDGGRPAKQDGIKSPIGKKGPTRSAVTTSSQWIQQSLDTHNFFRSLHQTPPLVLNNTLSEIRQYYANNLLTLARQKLDSQGKGEVYFDHNPEIRSSAIGENLYYSIMNTPIEPVPSHYAVLLWYQEIKDYDFKEAARKATSTPDALIGHLTQLLWKGTTQMGTAFAATKLRNNQTVTFVVANYYTTGNYIGQKYYLENVLPPTISEPDVNAAIVSKNIQGWWKSQQASKSKSETPASWRKDALTLHNKYRKAHGSQPLRLNKDICKVSQNWADYLLERSLQNFNAYRIVNQIERNYVGSSVCKLGESSEFFITGSKKTLPDLTAILWYNQIRSYNFDSQKQGEVRTDGFQQMIWNSTTEFCMSYASGKAENGQYLTYVVANYYPAITHVAQDRKINIFRAIIELDEDGNEVKGCCSGGAIFAIIFCILVVILAASAGYIYKYKREWYQTALKTMRLKK